MLPPTMESVVDEDDSTNSLPPDVQKLNDLIRNGVDRLDSFEDIKRQIILSNFSPLTNYPDIEYVRRYYVEYSCELWINESVVAIISITDGEEMGALIGMFSHINAICNIENVCQPWNESDYFQILLKHKHLISSAEQTKYVSNWKMECLKAIVTATKTIRNEIDFIEAFLNLIITVKKQYLKYLQLLDAKTDKITLKDIYDRIMKVSKYFNSTDLQEFTRIVNRKNLRVQFHLSSMFFDLVSNLDKSPELVVDEIDGRKIILVSALNLVMSDVIKNVEHLLMNDADILEVRFIGGHIIHADVDLQNNVWHGKNIVAFTRVLKVHGKVTWDVSGKDNNKVYESDAGTDDFGNGLQGNDGFAGESGGNVLIQADQMRNSIEFNVISNGGMGSPGQNGGNGRNGANGIGICNESFKNNFPPICNVSEPYSSIRKSFESVEVDDSSKFYKCFRNIFIKGKTYEGFESTFGARTCYRAFVLCEGLPAKPAGIGGEFGLGGHGGYPGQIDGVIGETKPGIPGCNGEGGSYGKPGINGWDMGYIDYFKFFGFGKSTQYFGTSENYRLALQKYTFSGDNHVWCEHLQSYITIEKSSVINANVKYYSEKRTTRSNYDRKSHALPSRKKTISKTNVHEVYSKYVNAGIEALESRRSDLTELEKLAALEIQKSFKQKQKISSKLKKHIAQNSFISSRQISMDDCTTNLNMNSVETNGISKLFEAFIEINSKLMFQMRNENIDELEREQYFPRIITRSLVRNYISSQSLGSLDKFLFENYEK
ncbi:uncharacterized protein LOC113386952 [Ctenocephalides felis]|uniref:uncharacterized protein LOC113386952 n=1 Tax=Ctenocephalides felis TaxID=7515 RepID=UPI000E6E36E2|nr:uncharacterized protein LOC113386952 [Ctenocephalides felis]